MVDFMLQD